ncbi:MAG: hypothetical protein AVDCRST_MAG27-593 [uncultured Craurococcus sp.]|uniref:Uncharacterized protein n=1 Tax=uncultured Craurococcus sp. TaxID=1135998 RepID=A0A6J4HIU1_9PROT|nr:MAG: hypothetical protein AVDCRST_MAG27-593 [uncultured Craurococcus sp.]
MLCKISPIVVLALGLGAAPAFAQSALAPATAPEGSTAARTLEQNRRVLTGQPAPSEALRSTAAEPEAPAASARPRARNPAPGGG